MLPPRPDPRRREARTRWGAVLLVWLASCAEAPTPTPARAPSPTSAAPSATAVAPAPVRPAQCDERALTLALRSTGAIPRPVRNQVEVTGISCDDDLAHATVVLADEPDGTSAFFRWNGSAWRVVDFGSDCTRPPPGVDAARCQALTRP